MKFFRFMARNTAGQTPNRPPFDWRRYFFIEATGAPYLTALATIFLGLAAFWQGSNALQLAHESNLLSQNAFRVQAENSLRPVVMREEHSVTIPTAGEGSVVINYHLHNNGNSPARKLRSGRHISTTLWDEVVLTTDSLGQFAMLLPQQTRESSSVVRWADMPDSFYVHNFVIYEYRLPVPQQGDTTITYIYTETNLFHLDGEGIIQVGAEEIEVRQPVRACVIEFHHPDYRVSGVR